MHDDARDPWLEPDAVRRHVLDELGRLPEDEHLAVLAALDRRDVEIVLTARSSVTIVVGDRWEFVVPTQRRTSEG